MSAHFDVEAIAGGEKPAERSFRRAFAMATTDERKDMLTALTHGAGSRYGTGSEHCLDLLLSLLREHRILHPPIRRYLMTDDDVDSAEQQALVAIAYAVSSYRGSGSALSWMNQIAANEAKMLIRSRQRHASRAAGTVDDHAGEFVQRVSTFVADQATVERCLGELRVEWKDALILREQGHSYEDVAAQLAVPVGTAKTWVSRARRALADLLIDHSMFS